MSKFKILHLIIMILLLITCISLNSFSDIIKDEEKIVDVTRCVLNNDSFRLKVFTRFSLPEKLIKDSSSYFWEEYFQVINDNTKKAYIIKLSKPDDNDSEIRIIDHTYHLSFPYPIFEIISVGNSDVTTHEFIGLENDTLRHLFELTHLYSNTLERKDSNIISGFVSERDELVSNFYHLPFEVSTNNFKINFIEPEIVDILWESCADQSFEGYRILESGKRVKYKVKKGTKLYIESLDRKNQLVKITIKKQTIFVPFKDIDGKVMGNGAG